jgi:hypothetical protein
MNYKPRVGDLLSNGTERVLVGDVNVQGGSCDDCFSAPWHTTHAARYTLALNPGWRLVGNVLKQEKGKK